MNSSFKTMTLVSALATSAMLTSGTLLPSANATCEINDSEPGNTFNVCTIEDTLEIKIYNSEVGLTEELTAIVDPLVSIFNYKDGSDVYFVVTSDSRRRGSGLKKITSVFNMNNLPKQTDGESGEESISFSVQLLNSEPASQNVATQSEFNLGDVDSTWHLREDQQIFGQFKFRKEGDLKRELKIVKASDVDESPTISFTDVSRLHISQGITLTSYVPVSFEAETTSRIVFKVQDKDNYGQLVVVTDDRWTLPSLSNLEVELTKDNTLEQGLLDDPIILLEVQKLDGSAGMLSIGDNNLDAGIGASFTVGPDQRRVDVHLAASEHQVLLKGITEPGAVLPVVVDPPVEPQENPDPPAAPTPNKSGELMILNNLWSDTGMAYGDQVGTKVRFDWFSGLGGSKDGWAINVTASGDFSYANVDFNATLHYHRLTVDSAVDDLLAGIFKIGTSQKAGLFGHGYLGIGTFLAKNTNRLAYLVGGELGYNFIFDGELSFPGVVIELKPELEVNLAVASNIKDSTVTSTDTNILFNSAFGLTTEFARTNDFADVSYSFIVPLYGTVTVEHKKSTSTTSVVGSFKTGLGFNVEYKEFFVASVDYNLEVDKSYVKNSIGVSFQFKL